jgi:hypothetical protein
MEELRAQVKLYRTKTAKGSELNSKLLGLMSQVSSTQPCPLSLKQHATPSPRSSAALPQTFLQLLSLCSQCLWLASVSLVVSLIFRWISLLVLVNVQVLVADGEPPSEHLQQLQGLNLSRSAAGS